MTDEVASSEASPRELDGEIQRLRQHAEQLEADVSHMSRELRDLREDRLRRKTITEDQDFTTLVCHAAGQTISHTTRDRLYLR